MISIWANFSLEDAPLAAGDNIMMSSVIEPEERSNNSDAKTNII